LPGETRDLTATYRARQAEAIRVDMAGWNVNHSSSACPQS
jgi:hypothetical protein